jgi:L-lactate dehydrogenase complex protein LldG
MNDDIASLAAPVASAPRGRRTIPEDAPLTDGGIASLVALFDKRLNELRAPGDSEPAVLHARDADDAARHIAALCHGVPREDIVFQGHAPSGPPRDFAIGVTPASALIAATGSVVVELASPADAWPSLLVDRHVVVADRSQLLPDLPTFYQRLHDRYAAGERLPIQVCITGCSRTADIEKLLVIPAHGPRQVRVVLCDVPVEWDGVRRVIVQ